MMLATPINTRPARYCAESPIKFRSTTENSFAVSLLSKNRREISFHAVNMVILDLLSQPLAHRGNRSQKQIEIEPKIPFVNVFQVQFYACLKRWFVARGHLPQPRHSGPHFQAAQLFQGVLGVIVKRVRAGPHETHVAFEDVPKLRKLVETVLAQPFSRARHPGIAGDLEKGPC